ncbi:hypothetical protein [Zhongshania aquimaris]|uniref:PEGA domain-containing protein n=1 Tax=Zhongshania aquimaris TaxID=2857107 RepID=A0ABS6VVV9_9GAMM|nr:hypothetical protein [Zhongshania aquimaris]MBW2942463.1 hypothetical protein [Zhongshania aquimaris]
MSVKELLKKCSIILIFSLLTISYASAESVLRVTCKDSASDAAVFINGKSYGKCPADIFLDAGEISLRVVKAVDAERERVFETTLTLRDNRPEKVNVVLASPQLNQNAAKARAQEALQKAKEGDIAAMQQVSDFYEKGLGLVKSAENSEYWSRQALDKQDENAARAILTRAEAGDIDAMAQLTTLYEQGLGVERSEAEAQFWQQKREQAITVIENQETSRVFALAKEGDIAAMRQMAEFYREGKGIDKSSEKAAEWEAKAAQGKVQQARAEANKKRKQEVEAELVDYRSGKAYMSGFIAAGKMVGMDAKGGDTSAASSIVTFSPTVLVVTAVGLATDLVSAPFNATTHRQLQNELNARAAVWDKPNSMVAKAYAQQ